MNETNQILVVIFASISIICSILIFTTFVCLREVRTLTRQIIVCITIADFFTALGNLSGVLIIGIQFDGDTVTSDLSTSWCTIQSFVSSTSSLCSFLWTMVLSLALYQVLVKENIEGFSSFIPWLHIFCWLLPLAINIVALSLRKLGYYNNTIDTGGWCWIAGSNKPDERARLETVLWMTIDGKLIEILTYCVMCFFFYFIKKNLKMKLRKISRSDLSLQNSMQNADNKVKAMILLEKKLVFLPVLLILLRIWGTLRYFLFIAKIEDNCGWEQIDNILKFLQCIGDSSQATVNFIIFCVFTPKIRVVMCDNIKRIFCCAKRQESSTEAERRHLLAQ